MFLLPPVNEISFNKQAGSGPARGRRKGRENRKEGNKDKKFFEIFCELDNLETFGGKKFWSKNFWSKIF